MTSFVEFINACNSSFTLGAVSRSQISDAQRILELHFASEYRDYVSAMGTASFASHELTGICPSPRLNVVEVTLRQRAVSPDVPKNWYVVEELNIDDVVIWQDETGSVYQTIAGRNPAKMADSLLEYYSSDA